MATTKRTTKARTASGETATPVEGEPYQWLVRVSQHTWWVIELESRSTRVEDVHLSDFSRTSGWGVYATARKLTKKHDEVKYPGWYVEVGGNASVPYRRMDLAVEMMLWEISDKRRIREARSAEMLEA